MFHSGLHGFLFIFEGSFHILKRISTVAKWPGVEIFVVAGNFVVDFHEVEVWCQSDAV